MSEIEHDPVEDPVKAADEMLHQTRDNMSGELYDEHEEVREWAMNIEWAYTALNEELEDD